MFLPAPAALVRVLTNQPGIALKMLFSFHPRCKRGRGGLSDPELINQFKAIELMDEEDRHVVKKLIDAFITKKQVQKLAH